ncbi:MAG TPA: outer membrane lipoprotein chaperone LolA [Steroidobacteraceae bacterium]|nr:outer membrane lipoprotein chaperone LolA [Steroidobacteraceae bacterium]
MNRRRLLPLLGALGLALAGGAHADETHTALDAWLSGLKSLRAQFTQTITDAQGRQTDKTTGDLLVLRPGKFRWDSHDVPATGSAPADSGQVLIADGRNVWFYDRDLQQVTVKPFNDALTATPLMLLSGGADARKAFEITDAGSRDGLSWVRVKPRATDADFHQALLGFGDGELRQMILEDKLGQNATLVFSRSQRNAPVSQAEVSFTPPKGVDVLGKPQM